MILTILIIPFLWAGVAIIAALLGTTYVITLKNGDKLTVLGMQASGKTRFLSFLRKVEYIERATGQEEYKKFTYKFDKDRSVTIQSGVDRGGGDNYKQYYKKSIEESDIILFLFNLNEYINENVEYVRETNSRFELIYDFAKKQERDVVIIGTHKDLLNFSEDNIKKNFDEKISTKSYKDLFKAFILINLTDKADIEKQIKLIFK
ncbi:MAG: GTPase domain-containing protein [Bacteroidetes bacterium]|nr:GTPase domain-containing protein [Bacteroidota bacterium]